MRTLWTLAAVTAIAFSAAACRKGEAAGPALSAVGKTAEAKTQPTTDAGLSYGDVTPGMTYDQLVEKKGRHFKLLLCNLAKQPSLVAYRYDDVTVVISNLKVQTAWPTAAKDKQLAELTSKDPASVSYADADGMQ